MNEQNTGTRGDKAKEIDKTTAQLCIQRYIHYTNICRHTTFTNLLILTPGYTHTNIPRDERVISFVIILETCYMVYKLRHKGMFSAFIEMGLNVLWESYTSCMKLDDRVRASKHMGFKRYVMDWFTIHIWVLFRCLQVYSNLIENLATSKWTKLLSSAHIFTCIIFGMW